MFWRQVLGLVLAFPGVLADSRSRWANKDTFGMATLMVGVGKPGRQGGRPGCVQPRGRTVQQGCGLPEPPPSSSEYLTDFVPPTSLFRVLPAFGGFLEVAQWAPAASRFLLPPAMTHRILLLTALALSHGFNLDTENAVVFQENANGFGQSVVQLEGSRLVVGAPQEVRAANQTGGLYQCDYSTGTCEPIRLQVPPEAVNMSLGLSLTFATNPSRLLACGPTVHQICKENTYVNGLCFLFGSNLHQQPQRVPETLRGCPQQESDIAFLIDGSGSINRLDFQRMKEFVSTVMGQFQKSKTLFALMQYSEDFYTHFTFNDFKRNPSPELLVRPIRQLLGRTHTATGIRKVVRELFHSKSGARENALKILVVITDGEKFGDPLGYEDVIPEADRKGVIRYVIGVGDAFNSWKSREELNTIASKPSGDHVFQVTNFEALKTIQNQLQEKIFAIEGTQTGSTSSFEYEMSQEGFSAAITSNGPLLGAVGSFDWAGGAFLHMPKDRVIFINTTRVDSDMNDAYLGYAVEVILRNQAQSLVLGAPRYQHTGLVVMFKQNSGAWEKNADIKGSQIGSYFGASLCSVDVNRDGSSDLVLIGAPHYYEQTRGGQVSVCPLPRRRAKWRCRVILCGEQGHPWSRFGAALTALGDVNGDGLTDVAIGAPGEQDNRGAVYLFHGTSELGISPSHSQRIAGSQLSPRLQYFGQSLSGGQDLTMDGLMDLAVGAQGHVFLLRSQPVLRVEASMVFKPREVARNVYECRQQAAKTQIAGEVQVCLQVRKSTWDRLREGDTQSIITYDLALDPGRPHPRAVFEETKNNTRRQTQTLGLSRKCEHLTLWLPDCVEDSVTPIVLRLNFSLVGKPASSFGNLRPVLAVDAQRLFTALFPFEKNCGNDSICQDDLSITFSFMSLDTLVVGGPRDLKVTLTVRNQGEDSYRTQVTFFYPSGLSYRKVSASQSQRSQRSWRLACESDVSTEESTALKSTSCSINHPIFPDNSEVTFNVTFDVNPDAFFGYKLLLKANVTSENNMPSSNKTEFQLELPVKYAVYVMVTSLEVSTKYFNFTASEKTRHVIEHQYQFNNLGQRKLPISVVFWVPVRLNRVTVWDQPQVTFSQNLSRSCSTEEIGPRHSDFLEKLQKTPVLNCSIAVCQKIQCDIPSFGIQEELKVTLKGNLSFDWYIKTSHNHLQVVSTAEVLFNDSQFALLPGQEAFVRAQTETKVEPYEVHNPLPLIVGSSIGGLVLLALITAGLYKLGFFKRQYKDMMSEPVPEPAVPQ
uniref:VWFA domain-containing protein n=1 Tax=Sus scrofa TaxID=9823 RepID=A0A8D1DEB3_PIG